MAVAVYARRSTEPAILDDLCERATDVRIKPFATKARDLDEDRRGAYAERLLADHDWRLGGVHHDHHGRADTHRIEGVLSALLVDEFLPVVDGDPLVLLDGGPQKVATSASALSALRDSTPPMTNCIRAETYYPHSLLADLVASVLAIRIHRGEYRYDDPMVRAPPVGRVREDEWGRAYSAVVTSRTSHDPEAVRSRFGRTARERIRCWFDGAVARDADATDQFRPSVGPILTYLRREGYGELAAELGTR